MQSSLVFVPVTDSERLAVGRGEKLSERRVFTLTRELMAALEYGPDQIEDGEYAAMVIASVAGLTDFGERVVLVAELADNDLTSVDAENGEFSLKILRPEKVVAFFVDEPTVDTSLAAKVAKAMTIDQAWEQEAVQVLLTGNDLLWHDAVELSMKMKED